jgi:uncharacterized protein YjiS (DUF1127 family)
MTCANKTDARLLREDHFLCVVMDAVLAIQGAAKRWLKRRRTRELLAALDEHQLRDIGLTRADVVSESAILRAVVARRDQVGGVSATISTVRRWWTNRDASRRALAELDDDQLSNLSDIGRRIRRQAQHVRQRGVVSALRPSRATSPAAPKREVSAQ